MQWSFIGAVKQLLLKSKHTIMAKFCQDLLIHNDKSQTDDQPNYFKDYPGWVQTCDLLLFIYFLFFKQRLRPLGYCARLGLIHFYQSYEHLIRVTSILISTLRRTSKV